jgi:hypothetical protein
MRIWHRIRGFRGDEAGVALVEFAIVLPILLLFLAIAVEGGRTFWSYQAAIAGVRDATRYMSHAISVDFCSDPYRARKLADLRLKAMDIVSRSVSGEAVFPDKTSITSVTLDDPCSGRAATATTPLVAKVTAVLAISYPFSGIFAFANSSVPNVRTQVVDMARVFGA